MATYRALLSLKSSLDDPDSRLSALRLLNVFNRTFPPELSNLTNLRVLDLYNNNLTGVLPVSVATFHWRESFGGIDAREEAFQKSQGSLAMMAGGGSFGDGKLWTVGPFESDISLAAALGSLSLV
ncbi:hypothetical protein ACLB2K_017000 [Fragaria x ananassa]